MDPTKEATEGLLKAYSYLDKSPAAAYGRNFKPRTSDVFISTYPKCGTTWVSQICHQLRSGGDMDFQEIAQVVPWDVIAKQAGQDLDAEHKFSPRLFKSHEKYANVAKGGKHVVVVRNPTDAFYSWYHFTLAVHKIPSEVISMEHFVKMPQAWGILPEWYAEWYNASVKKEVEVLWVFYEDLQVNVEREIRRIADFIGVGSNEEKIQLAMKFSTVEFMQKHGTKFNEGVALEALQENKLTEAMATSVAKVGAGKTGAGKLLPQEVEDVITEEWTAHMAKPLGFANYEAFHDAVRKLS